MLDLKQCPLGILQSEFEINKLVKEVLHSTKVSLNILEIGSLCGGTLWCWKEGLDIKKLVSVDYIIPMIDGRYKGVRESREKWAEILKDIEFVAIEADSKLPTTVEFVKQQFPEGIDFLFIDGGHDYDTVKADYENYSPFVNKGGIIAFHDTQREISKYWNEVKSGKKFAEFCENNLHGRGIGVIYKE